MFPALISNERTATQRAVIYVGSMLGVVFAAVLLSFHGGLRASGGSAPVRGIPAHAQIHPRLAANYGKLPLSFELNQGQADAGVKFLSRGRGYGLFLTSSEAVLELRKSSLVSGPLSVGTKQNPSPSSSR
jgi:hypothetical protein